MTRDPDNNVTLTDSHTTPATDPGRNNRDAEEDTPDEPRTIPQQLLSGVPGSLDQFNDRLPIPAYLAGILFLGYLAALVGITISLTPFHGFGVLSATTGVIILVTVYHPEGNIEPETTFQTYLYPVSGLVFIGVGLRYLLMGILFRVPFA